MRLDKFLKVSRIIKRRPVSTSSAMAFLSLLFVGSLCSLSIITPSSVIVNPDCFEHKTSTICL